MNLVQNPSADIKIKKKGGWAAASALLDLLDNISQVIRKWVLISTHLDLGLS